MNEIWIARADGSQMRPVTVTPEGYWSRAPTWSPDGRMIAFVSNRSGSRGADYGELFVVDLETGAIRQMTDTGGNVYDWRPAWRP
jgi:TolB protein